MNALLAGIGLVVKGEGGVGFWVCQQREGCVLLLLEGRCRSHHPVSGLTAPSDLVPQGWRDQSGLLCAMMCPGAQMAD